MVSITTKENFLSLKRSVWFWKDLDIKSVWKYAPNQTFLANMLE